MHNSQMMLAIYEARDGFRWRALRGGRIVAESGEAYSSRRNCVRALEAFKEGVRDAVRAMPPFLATS